MIQKKKSKITRRIKGKKYKIPQNLAGVTLSQFIAFSQQDNRRSQLKELIQQATSVREQNLLHLQYQDVMDRMLVAISDIPYAVISKLNTEEKSEVYLLFNSIFEVVHFKVNPKQQIDRFKFDKQTFYLFEFGAITAKQMLWFETYWKQFYEVTANEIYKMNFEQLSRLIAICAFPKGEIDTIINDDRELPLEIKPEYYKDFSTLVEQRTEDFKQLPLEIVYGCLNFFFVNSRYILQTIQTSIAQMVQLN